MFPIKFDCEEKTFAEDFAANLTRIAIDHHKNNRAMVFAIILYSKRDYQIVKILNDDDYWQSLNSVSGTDLTFFYFSDYSLSKRKKEIIHNQNTPFPTFQYMIPGISSKIMSDNEVDVLNCECMKLLNIDLEKTLPLLAFFQVNDETVTRSFALQMNNLNTHDVFSNLLEIVTKAVESLKNVSAENKMNYDELFNLVEGRIKSEYSAYYYINKITNLKIFEVIKIINSITSFRKSFP